jgi:hypothetical protein
MKVYLLLVDFILHLIKVLCVLLIGEGVCECYVHELLLFIPRKTMLESDLSPLRRADPTYPSLHPLPSPLVPQSVYRPQPSFIEAALMVHVLDGKFQYLVFLSTLDTKVEPGAEPAIFEVGQAIG